MERAKLILCVLFPSFRIQALIRKTPALRDLPVVLYGSRQRGQNILEVSGESRSEGIREGMSLAQARIRYACLRELEEDVERDLSNLQEVAEALGALSPTISLAPPDGVFCDMTGLLGFFGGVEKIRECLDRILEEWGVEARAVLTSSATGAWALAKYGGKGWQHIPGESIQTALAELPVEALRMSEEICKGLRRVGLERIGDVARCPLAMLNRRYAIAGEELYARARGRDVKELEPFRPVAPLKASVELVEPCEILAPLLFAAKRLLDGLQSRMRGRGVAAVRLGWLLGMEDGEKKGEVALPRPQRSSQVLLTILRELWGSLSLSAPVCRLEFWIPEVAEGAEETEDLFIRRVSSGETLDELMARLGASLGPNAVFSPRPASSHRPESGVRRVPFQPEGRKKRRLAPDAQERHDERVRPLRLLTRPEPVEWVTRFNRLNLRDREGREYLVKAISGPERILGEWWRQGFARDYHRVQLDPGTLWWVFRDLQGDGWFLHGMFD